MKNQRPVALLLITSLLCPFLLSAETTYSVSVSETEYEIGDSIDIDWTMPADSVSTNNWVGLYHPDATNQNYLTWKYVEADTSGSVSLSATKVGDFEVRLFTNNSYDDVVTSDTFTVSEPDYVPPEYELTLSDTEIALGDGITVTWEVVGDDNVNSDWIGLYEVGSSNQTYRDWSYTGATEGSETFHPTAIGEYEIRYFNNNSYTDVAVSETFIVIGDGGGDPPGGDEYILTLDETEFTTGDAVTVTWSTDTSDNLQNDWIGLYKVGTTDIAYKQWSYINGETGQVSFTIYTAGDYEFRYFKNNSFTKVATSEEFAVIYDDTEPPPQDDYAVTSDQDLYEVGDVADAIWDAPDGKFIFLDWIGLYKVGTADNAYLDWEYVDRLSNREHFPLTQTGTFEFRYFLKNNYTKVATSDPFTVVPVIDGNLCNGYDLDQVTNYPTQAGPIIALGDSITLGLGASDGENYVEELEKRLGVDIINQGVSSDTTQDVLERLETDVLDENPSTVIVFIGGNDELRRLYDSLSGSVADQELKEKLDDFVQNVLGYQWEDVPLLTLAETFSNLEEIVTRIQDTGANTIVVGFDNTLVNYEIYTGYQTVAEDTGSVFIPDIYEDIFGRVSKMSDLVHPNDDGYDIVADRIQLGLECLLAN